MAYQGIGTGTSPNDNTGDSLLTGAVKINSNFEEIYNALGAVDGNIIPTRRFILSDNNPITSNYFATSEDVNKILLVEPFDYINLVLPLGSSIEVGDWIKLVNIGSIFSSQLSVYPQASDKICGFIFSGATPASFIADFSVDVQEYSFVWTGESYGWRLMDGSLSGFISPTKGEAVFTSPGTYTWTPPFGTTEVSVICIGGGGAYDFSSGRGGGGGGLGWRNTINVEFGTEYTVEVGSGGISDLTINGTDSYFIRSGDLLSQVIVKGSGATSGGIGGDYVGEGGGNGGNGGTGLWPGGGGAGGYSGNGGNGGDGIDRTTGTIGFDGTGGAGGGGGGWWAGCGGGVGLYGEGESGIGGDGSTSTSKNSDGFVNGGSGGSGGQAGSSYNNDINLLGQSRIGGGIYGGGGGRSFAPNGANGAVRIVWGADEIIRPFP